MKSLGPQVLVVLVVLSANAFPQQRQMTPSPDDLKEVKDQEAAGWKMVAWSRTCHVYYRKGSLRDVGGYKRSWKKSIYVPPNDVDGKKVAQDVALEECDCNERRQRILSSVYYDAAGDALYSDDQPAEWAYAVPDSIAETYLSFICSDDPDADIDSGGAPASKSSGEANNLDHDAEQSEHKKPITERGLILALKTKGMSDSELIAHIMKRGVNFRLTTEARRRLQTAGASSSIINACEVFYKGQ
ncbi:MAG TPA: surface-adhesin E family protein [Blastocatellia bacterium]